MQITSEAYKTEQRKELRNRSFVYVYLGVINKEAQATAYVVEDDDYALAPISTEGRIFAETDLEAYYATLEDGFTKVDGSFMFRPSDVAQNALFQGAVTDSPLGAIMIAFDGYSDLEIKGLTINFGEYFPTRFTVTNGTVTYEYSKEREGEFVCEDVFNNTGYFIITPLEMVGGEQRLRILSIQFGVGLTFDNKTIISTSRVNSVSHLSAQLPTKSFTFTIDNTSKRFSKDDPNSFVNFLEEQQECEYEYGRELDDGTIYRIPGGKTSLKAWSSNDQQAKFSTVGKLDFLDTTFYKGQYRPSGINAYDLAVEVLQDAGIENYVLDSYLKKLTLKNPLPVDTHKNCLQMIANAARSVLFEDRDGNVVIKSSFVPDILSAKISIASAYSRNNFAYPDKLVETHYASCENNFTKVDGTYRFIPADFLDAMDDADATGSAVSDSSATFPNDVSVYIRFNAQWTFYGITIEYEGQVPPKAFVYQWKNGRVFVKMAEYTNTRKIVDIFDSVDAVTIVYQNTTNQGERIHINSIRFDETSDFEIRYKDMSKTPIASSVEKVRVIDSNYFRYSYGTEETTAASPTLQLGDNVVTFSSPFYDYSAKRKDTEASVAIKESGAYYCIIDGTNYQNVEVDILAKPIEVANMVAQIPVREIGTTKTVGNELIDNYNHAVEVGEWVRDYFDSDTEYDVSYRGEPAIDCDDQIYLENRFVTENLIRVESEQLDTSIGMSMNCKVKGRRIRYGETTKNAIKSAVVGTAIVDKDVTG